MINSSFLSTNLPLLCTQLSKTVPIFAHSRRTYINTDEHFEPRDINWQWTPRRKPCFHCPNFCQSRKCPEPRFFLPRWKRPVVPVDIQSCPREVKKEITLTNSSLSEYFSYLLPDSMQEDYKRDRYKPPERCRVLLEKRRNKCVNPHSCLCCRHRTCPPSEWYDQAVLHTLIGGGVYPPEARPLCGSHNDVEQHPPPSFMVPKCITNLKGLCKEPYKCETTNEALPFKENMAPAMKPPPKVKPYKFKPKKKIYFMVPDINERAVRLSCKHYADFKTVECPPALFTRYKSVAGSPPGPVEASCDSGNVRPQTEPPTCQPPICPTTGCPMSKPPDEDKGRSYSTLAPYQSSQMHSSAPLSEYSDKKEHEIDRLKRCAKDRKKKNKDDVIYNDIIENQKCIQREVRDKCEKEKFENLKNDPCPCKPPGGKCKR